MKKNRQRINLLNIQEVQYQETNQHNKKLGRKSKQTFLQRIHTDVQETHEKMLNTSHFKERQIKTTFRYHLIWAECISSKNYKW